MNVVKPTVPTLDFSVFSRMKRFPVTPLTPVSGGVTGNLFIRLSVNGVTGNLFIRLNAEKSNVGTVGFATFVTRDIDRTVQLRRVRVNQTGYIYIRAYGHYEGRAALKRTAHQFVWNSGT